MENINEKINKSRQAYLLKVAGQSNSQIARALGVLPKTVPTLAKGYMKSHALPAWSGAPESINKAAEEGVAYAATKKESLKAKAARLATENAQLLLEVQELREEVDQLRA